MSVTHTITGGLVHLTGNPIEVILTASGSRLNHKLALKISCTALMGSPYVEEIAPLNLVSKFDISGFVDQPVQYSFDYPAIGYGNPHDALVFNVSVQAGEVWTDANGDRQEAWYGSSALRISKGKLRPHELAILNEAGKSFASEYIEGGKFLTHLPNNQIVGPNQFARLWYMGRWTSNHSVTANLSVETDLKIARIPNTHEFILYDITRMMEFIFNPEWVGFTIGGLEIVTSFTFWLTDTATGLDVSERRTFIVDDNYYDQAFEFYYVNPLSGGDCIRLTGEHTEGLKTESETAYRPVPVGSGTKVASMKTISSGDQRTWELNTGIKTRAEMLALRDFMTAKERWMVDPDNSQKLIPVYIEGGNFALYNSMEDLQSLEITILEAHK